MSIFDRIWKWPDGYVWRVTRNASEKSRRHRFEIFLKEIKPTAKDRVLDVGVGVGQGEAVNFFDDWYPWRKQITAVALEDLPVFRKIFPEIKFVIGDGKKLPFADNSFEIVFSNAVLEHVGSTAEQKKFISEACRVGDKVFLSTPNRWFPLDSHTMIPLAHWLPLRWRNFIYKLFGRDFFASEKNLHLISQTELRALVPKKYKVKIIPQRILGMTSNFNIIISK